MSDEQQEQQQPKRAEKVDPAAAIQDQPLVDSDGESGKIDPRFQEPKGTRHTDQYNTAFTEDGNVVRP